MVKAMVVVSASQMEISVARQAMHFEEEEE